MAKKRAAAKTRPAKPAKKKSAPAAGDMRVRVRDLTLQLVQERNLKLSDLLKLGDEVLGRATKSIQDAVPKSRQSALRKIVDGFADAWATTARAGASAVRHAQENGMRSAKRDMTRLSKDLGSLEQEFVGTLDKYAGRLQGDVADEFKSVVGKVRRTGTAIGPAVRSAGKAVMNHPLSTAAEIASAGLKVGADAVSGALLTASGLLEGLGKSLRGAAPQPNKKTPAGRTAKSKPTGKR